ncbi:hypothetical protein STCU_00500 [Strigomonas culicis]|nr:hypothetical protein STCU_00500 [Strigomonas culicis]|eukprot:EPY36600.1 hypothetical protein STCU_00500 [Strigomonas culicis]
MRAYKKGKQVRETKKKQRGESFGVPSDVKAGKMNPELYEIECRLYREAGLPKPKPYLGYERDRGAQKRSMQRVGFVDFKDIISAVRKRNS